VLALQLIADGEGRLVARKNIEPGEPAPATGIFEEHSLCGTSTAFRTFSWLGEPMPPLPAGFCWRLAVMLQLPMRKTQRPIYVG
jgi:hypothetical protein